MRVVHVKNARLLYISQRPSLYSHTTNHHKTRKIRKMSLAKVCLSLLVFATFLNSQDGKNTREWYKEHFPNPERDAEACGQRGNVFRVCDPENILSYEAANKIQEFIFSVVENTDSGCRNDEKPGFQIGVAVLNRMRGIPGETVEETAKTFAKHLHDSWGVGHAGCDDGAMLLISILDRQLYVSTGKRAMELLSDDQIDIIIEEMKPYMLENHYDEGVKLAIFRMGEVFSGKVLERSTNNGVIIFCVLLFILSALMLLIGNKDEQGYGTRIIIGVIMEEERDRESNSCPICRDIFQPNTRLLACGHRFCEPCLTPWLNINPNCPMCRLPADPTSLPGVRFLLRGQHPQLVTDQMVNKWSSTSDTGSFTSDPIFFRSLMAGGSSSGSGARFCESRINEGGGRGGSW